MPIVKVIDDFDFELLEYMFAVHNLIQSDLSRLGYDGAAKKQELGTQNIEKAKLYHDVHRLKSEGKSISEIARLQGIARNTVKKHLKASTREFLSEISYDSSQEYQRDIIEHLYADHGVSIRHIYNEVQKKYDNNIKVGYRQFARYVKKLREKHKIEKD